MNYREKATGRIVQASKGYMQNVAGMAVRLPDEWVVVDCDGLVLRSEDGFRRDYEFEGEVTGHCEACCICGARCHPDEMTGLWHMRLCPECVKRVDECIDGLRDSNMPNDKAIREGTRRTAEALRDEPRENYQDAPIRIRHQPTGAVVTAMRDHSMGQWLITWANGMKEWVDSLAMFGTK